MHRKVIYMAKSGFFWPMSLWLEDTKTPAMAARAGKLVMGILALIAEFENDIRRERQLDGIAKAKERGVRFGVQPKLTEKVVKEIRKLRRSETVPEIMRHTGLSKASGYRALSRT
jgi:DNA invertase Pin-like site-specific DNA recombinase